MCMYHVHAQRQCAHLTLRASLYIPPAFTRAPSSAFTSRSPIHTGMPQDGRTPLFTAACNGHTEAVKALLASGADKDKSNKVCPLQSWVCCIWACSSSR